MADTLIHHGRFLDYYTRDGWEFVRRNNASDVVAVIACTADDDVVLVEQVRKPLGENGMRVIELPAGLVGDDGNQDVVVAAQRELEEETGFRAAQLAVVSRGPSSAGLCDEIITMVCARGLERVGPGGGLPGENITVHLVPRDEVEAWLMECSEAGLLVDPKVWAGLYIWASLSDD
ncbi:MAG: NUDIX hydrolase [Planctomycetota bacterium]|jgi:ADP-ribose pyrophosphatase|nr:NUDIX hydrolase [Planctomycetota bacterium]